MNHAWYIEFFRNTMEPTCTLFDWNLGGAHNAQRYVSKGRTLIPLTLSEILVKYSCLAFCASFFVVGILRYKTDATFWGTLAPTEKLKAHPVLSQ